jgi:hypothetical protein
MAPIESGGLPPDNGVTRLFRVRVLPEPMVIAIRRPWRPAVALAVGLACAVAAPAARPAEPLTIAAGTEGGYTFTIEAKSLARDGERVRFRLLSANVAGADHYDSTIEVDCTHRTRRQLSAIADDGAGDVRRYGAELSGLHAVSPGTRADQELRLVCARAGLQAADPPHRVADRSEVVDAGSDAGGAHAILSRSVQRHGALVDYMLQTVAPGQGNAVRRHVLVDCERKLRAIEPEGTPPGAKLPARPARADSREGRELAAACAMDGPANRWFAGFVVTADGVIVAPRERTMGCSTIVARVGTERRRVVLVAQEPGVSVLRLDGGGRWAFMPAVGMASGLHHVPVTMLGVRGTAPRVSAAFVEDAGSSADDAGWPQVATLSNAELSEGIVWDSSGAAVGLALAARPPERRGTRSYVRMLPVAEIRSRLRGHDIQWDASAGGALDAEAALRRAVSATLALTCESGT